MTGARLRQLSGLLWFALGMALSSPGLAADREDFVLATDDYAAPGLAPAFIGNGYLGIRIPFDGQGFAAAPVETLALVQGLFGRDRAYPWLAKVEARAALPIWSALEYDDGSGAFALTKGMVRGYRQSLDLGTGTISTRLDWTSPAGRDVHLQYDVFTDRARPHAAIVRLRFTPGFLGHVKISDVLDPATGHLISSTGHDARGKTQSLDLRTNGFGITASVASALVAPSARDVAPDQAPNGGTARTAIFDVTAGQVYEVTKYVGVAVSTDTESDPPPGRAIAAAEAEAALGYDGAKVASDLAWEALWQADIEISGSGEIQRAVRAALFTLFASARDDLAWAPSPGGLSTTSYMGHIFWDSETWMFPVYLATAPRIAERLLQYRINRVVMAESIASRGGNKGLRFPWESGLSGDEVVPIPIFGNGLHVSNDIALAFWQYWLATGDRDALARAFPALSGIADFWTSYARPSEDGTRSIRRVVSPDEDALARGRLGWFGILAGIASLVDDSAYTNMTARRVLAIATEAAQRLGRTPAKAWSDAAEHLKVPAPDRDGVIAEYAGYSGSPVKQADVTLLSYPWEIVTSRETARANMEFYVPRTNPDGPSMTDSIHSILASWIGAPGCSAYTFTRRSIDPFVRAPFAQLAEERAYGALTFATGAGGLLQEFIYGYTGLRWRDDALWLDPALPPQIDAINLHAVQWRGRTLRVDVGQKETRLTLLSGDAATIDSPQGRAVLTKDRPLVLQTRLPAEVDTRNVALCRPTKDSDGADASPVVDGSTATVWSTSRSGTALTVDLGREIALDSVAILRPSVIAVPGYSSFGPLFARTVLRPAQETAGETIAISIDGQTWTDAGQVETAGVADTVQIHAPPVRFVRVTALAASEGRPLTVGEIVVTPRPEN